ncbi:MAG: trehalase family glycosidase [Candidatus Saccharimonadales bacterium]
MVMDAEHQLLDQAKAVLNKNDQGNYTIPAEGLYPHQWLWDSCFTAIGLRNYDIERAQIEILSLLNGQWANGMIPHMIFSNNAKYIRDQNIWRSWINPFSPDHVHTSGITQPPLLAESIVKIGEKLSKNEKKLWYKKTYQPLVNYHQWLYKERDPHNEGLVLQIHPWETGLDNTPPWMQELHDHQLPLWIQVIIKLRLDKFVGIFRRDTHFLPASHRLANTDALAFYSIQRRLRRKRYDINHILNHSLLTIEDLGFNAIFIRANSHLREISNYINKELPNNLVHSMHKTEQALEDLWDPYANQYYSRNFVSHKLIKEPSISTLLPLYAGSVTQSRAKQLVTMLENTHLFGPSYPVPSVPLNSPWYNPVAYWQGPTWININWMIIDGLKRYGFHDHAAALTESSIELVEKNGCNEYFHSETGEAVGADNFSWTAALTIDLLTNK